MRARSRSACSSRSCSRGSVSSSGSKITRPFWSGEPPSSKRAGASVQACHLKSRSVRSAGFSVFRERGSMSRETKKARRREEQQAKERQKAEELRRREEEKDRELAERAAAKARKETERAERKAAQNESRRRQSGEEKDANRPQRRKGRRRETAERP